MHTIQARRKDILLKTQIMVNNRGFIIHKTDIRKDEGMIMMSIKRIILSLPKMF